MAAWTGKWKGGRTYEDRDGATRFVIEKMRKGARYSITLPEHITDAAAAESELALFKRSPPGYVKLLEERGFNLPDGGAVIITGKEIEDFTAHQAAEGLSAAYISGCSGYLTWWANALNGRDLRRVQVADLYKLLDTQKRARNYRIVALQSLCTYLTRRQRLKLGENAAALLEAKKAAPARLKKLRRYSIKQVEEFYAALDSQYIRDLFCVLAKMGCHSTEVGRMARNEVELLPGKGEIAAVVRFRHKSGRDHYQSIDAQCLAALNRLRAHKRTPAGNSVNKAVKRAADKLGWAEPIHPKYLRHTVATWLEESGTKFTVQKDGLSRQEVAILLGHRSVMMISDHYNQSDLPVLGKTALGLYHPSDPVQLAGANGLKAVS